MSGLRAGMIGLGAMGAPMARHLAAQGHLRGVWNRTANRGEALARELSVVAASDPAALAGLCDVVLICVSADADLRAVVRALLPGLRPGMVVVDTSTVSPLTARELAAELNERDVGFVDAPVSGGVEGAVKGRLSVMVGGKYADISRIRPLLDSFAATVTHMGAGGTGQAAKAVNQVMVGGIAEAVCEGLALAEKLNLDQQRLLSVLGAGAADSWFLQHRGSSMLQSRFAEGFKLALLRKDLEIVQSLARELDISLETVALALRDCESLVAGGDGDCDISALITLKRRPATGR